MVQETIDPNAKIEYIANTKDYPHKGKPDITKAKELHGWEPKVEFRKGLPLMVSDFGNASLVTRRNKLPHLQCKSKPPTIYILLKIDKKEEDNYYPGNIFPSHNNTVGTPPATGQQQQHMSSSIRLWIRLGGCLPFAF